MAKSESHPLEVMLNYSLSISTALLGAVNLDIPSLEQLWEDKDLTLLEASTAWIHLKLKEEVEPLPESELTTLMLISKEESPEDSTLDLAQDSKPQVNYPKSGKTLPTSESHLVLMDTTCIKHHAGDDLFNQIVSII